MSLLGDGTVADMLWARPALTVVAVDSPPVVGSSGSIVPRTRARLNLRIPPGVTPEQAGAALTGHLQDVAPWGVRVGVDITAAGRPFRARSTGPAHRRMAAALEAVYGIPVVELGQGGSIPLCSVLEDTYPDAEIILVGVEEPLTLIHAAPGGRVAAGYEACRPRIDSNRRRGRGRGDRDGEVGVGRRRREYRARRRRLRRTAESQTPSRT